MLEIKYIDEDIIEVKESILSFTKTTVSYYYIDIINWIRYNNRPCSEPMTVELLKSNPTPDKKYHDEQKMTDSHIEWAKKWYIPKAQNYSHTF